MSMGIYKLINNKTGKFYLGSSINIERRHYRHIFHLRKGEHHSPHLQRAFLMDGEKNFELKIIELVEDRNNLIEREQYWLDYYQPFNDNNGYNICKKADSMLGVIPSAETRLKISNKSKGRMNSQEMKEKMSLISKEVQSRPKVIEIKRNQLTNAWKDPDFRKKMSDSRKNMWKSREFRIKMRKIQKGHVISEDTKRKISEKLKNFHKRDSPEFIGNPVE